MQKVNKKSWPNKRVNHPELSYQVEIHPQSVKQIKKGHPWVTIDRFSEKFPTKLPLLVGLDMGKPLALLIHDPKHPTIKGRVWRMRPPLTTERRVFESEAKERIEKAINLRVKAQYHLKRDNFYLVFGEGDQLPGLFIQKLGQNIILQFYCGFWSDYQKLIMSSLNALLPRHYEGEKFFYWVQLRSVEQTALRPLSQHLPPAPIVRENGISVKLHLGERYDIGLYTDMAAPREKLIPFLQKSKSVLNLYAYSGMFSLLALQQGVQDVVSIDLSSQYLKWLEENLDSNLQLNKDHHTSLCQSVEEALPQLIKKGKKFDLIICDPPTSSTNHNQQKRSSLQNYKTLLPLLVQLLNEKGKMVLFHNGHQLPPRPFYQQIEDLYKNHPLHPVMKIGLTADCPTTKTFPEGEYLKGIILEKRV